MSIKHRRFPSQNADNACVLVSPEWRDCAAYRCKTRSIEDGAGASSRRGRPDVAIQGNCRLRNIAVYRGTLHKMHKCVSAVNCSIPRI